MAKGTGGKYVQMEHERRFLVLPKHCPDLDGLPCFRILDHYITRTRMRVRSVMDVANGDTVYKLCKKYGDGDDHSDKITNIYLTKEEYLVFRNLPSNELSKRRYHLKVGDFTFAVDVFEGLLNGLILAEVEAESRPVLEVIPMPDWVVKEVTGDLQFTGGKLCMTREPYSA